MNKFKNLELLKKTLSESLGSDELEDTIYFLDEYKRLKNKELKGRL